MNIAVTRDGNIFFGSLQIRVQDLPGDLQTRVRNGSEQKVYVKADARAKYGDVAAVVDAVRAAGVHKIAFLTDQRRP